MINSVYIAERRPLHAWSEWTEKKKVNFVIVVNSNVSTCWRLTFKLWIIISGSWLVILNSKSRQVRGQEQSWFYTDWLVTGVPRKKWFSSLLTLFFLAVCITVLLFLVYGVSNVSMMNAAIIRIWNCFTVVASNWDFLLKYSSVNYAHQACFDSAKAEICRKFLNRIWHHLNCCLFFLSNCFRIKVKGFKGNGPNPSRDVYMRLDNTANFPAECSV